MKTKSKLNYFIKTIKDKQVLKAGLGYTIGNFLIKGISFLTLPIFTRVLTTSDFGLYNTFMAYESFFVILISFGVYMSIKAAMIEYEKNIDEYISNIITYVIIVFFVFLGILFLLEGVFQNLFEFNRVLMVVMLLQSASTSVITIYNIKLSMNYSYKNYLLISLILAMSSVIISLILIFSIFADAKYYGRILGSALPSIMIAIYIIYLTYKKKLPSWNKEHLSFALKYSLPLVPHGISQIVLAQADRIMILKIIGSIEAGLYSFAYNIGVILQILSTSLDTVWGPWFFKNYKAGNFIDIKKRSSQYITLFSFITIMLLLMSPEFIKVLGSQEYRQTTEVVIPVLLATYFIFLYTIPAQLEYYMKKTGYIAISTVVSGGINILLNFIFIPKYGYIAAAYTTLITYTLNFTFHLIVSRKITDEWPFSLLVMISNILMVSASAILAYSTTQMFAFRWSLIVVILLISMVFVLKKIKIEN